MTCIKTGARLHIEPYGLVVPADIHQVADARIARVPPSVFEDERWFRVNAIAPLKADWRLLAVGDGAFWRKDLGVFVVPAACLFPLETTDA